jgi:hypothetical protein
MDECSRDNVHDQAFERLFPNALADRDTYDYRQIHEVRVLRLPLEVSEKFEFAWKLPDE